MSRILRRPMFRGGKIDSRGTGITTGLDQPKRGLVDEPGGYSGELITQRARSRIRGPYDFPLNTTFGSMFNADLGSPIKTRSRIRGPQDFLKGATIEDAEGLLASASGASDATDATVPVDPKIDFTLRDEIREEGPKVGVGSDFAKDVSERYLGGEPERDTGLEAIRLENIDKMNTSPKNVETPKKDDDEPEVTMTDLEKALGLDKARQEYAADALAAASKAFFEGRGFEAIADAAAVKSKAPDIKRLAGLEEFKAKKAAELFDKKTKRDAELKAGTKGSVQKTVDFLVSQGMDKDEAIKRATKQSGTFAEELSKNSVGGTILASGFALAAETFYGDNYKGDVTAVEVINADKSTQLPDGIYSDKENKLIFEVKDKKVVFDRSYS